MTNPSAIPGRIRALPWLTALLGLALTAAAWWLARNREARALETRFQAESAHMGRAVAWEMQLFTDLLQSLGPLHALSDRVSATDFAEFAGKGLNLQAAVLNAFGFAQWIPHSLRAAVEKISGAEQPRSLTEFDPEHGVRPAAERSEYYPLTYQFPEQGLGLPNGFDLNSLPQFADAVGRLSRSGQPALGPGVLLPASGAGLDGDRDSGFFVLAPIADKEGGLSGFTVAILRPQALLRRALDRTLMGEVQVLLYDPATGRPPPPRLRPWHEQQVRIADQPWILRCEALAGYAQAHATPLPWLALLAGALLTAALTAQTAGLVHRAARIEATVRARTAELREANDRLADEMRERARLEVEIEDVAEREKRRIGHDLHDSLGQKLTGAVYLNKALAGSLDPAATESRAAAEKINDLLKDAVAEVRRTARGLAPIEVGEEGLAQALHRLAEDACHLYGIACSFRAEGQPRPRDARTCSQLYRIAQEALTNAVRHGGVRDVQITLRETAEGGELAVRDNGRGFDPQAAHEGAGLRIMRHRARAIGGHLTLRSSPGAGSTVTCHFAAESVL